MWVVPVLHPSFIIRGAFEFEPFQAVYLRRVKAIADGQDPTVYDIEEAPPGSLLYPSISDLEEWQAGIGPTGVAVDIEAAGPHITIIGFCRVDDLVPVVVRFRRKGGATYDDDLSILQQRIAWTYDLLADPAVPKWFHNGQSYDIPQLERAGFNVAGYFDLGGDTMLAQHIVYPEAPKSLEFIAGVYPGIPSWKHLAKEAEGEGK